MRFRLICIGIVTLVVACVDPEDLMLRGTVDVLVVDGIINNLPEAQIIRLNRSKADPLTGRFGTLPITKATVEVIADSQVIAAHETVDGTYQLPSDFKGLVGHAYQLRFRLTDGTQYVSTQQVMQFVPVIDQVKAQFSPVSLPAQLYNGTLNQFRGAHEVTISWQDPADQHNYYRWDWKLWEKQEWCRTCVQGFYEQYNPNDKKSLYEACYAPSQFQFVSSDPIYGAYGAGNLYFVNDYPCRTDCWEILHNTDIDVFDDQYSNGGKITGRLIAKIPYYQQNGCLLEIRQSSLTQAAYSYFKLFQAQTQNTGGIADTPPTALVGNVHNVADSREKVVGYFTASAIAPFRYWIDRKDATGRPPGLFLALNGLLPSPEDTIDPNTGVGKPKDPLSGVIPKVGTAVCVSSDSRTPYKPEGWRD